MLLSCDHIVAMAAWCCDIGEGEDFEIEAFATL